MKKRVILHIGFPKTGTTSIQSFCFSNRERLAKAGILYPDLALADPGERPTASHKALMAALLNAPPERLAVRKEAAIADTDALFGQFAAGPLPTLVLSHETLSQREDLDFPRLQAWLAGYRLTVLAFVRTFDEWLESLYAQNLRGDQVVAVPFGRTRLAALERMRFLHPLGAFRAALPDARIKLLSFDRFRGGGLVERFLKVAGIDHPRMLARAGARAHVNASRPAADVMFGAYLSAALDSPILCQAAVTALARARDGGATVADDGARLRFVPAAVREQARELYRLDLPVLRAEFGLVADDPGPLSPDDPATAYRLSRDRFDALLAAAAPFLPATVPADTYDRAIARLG